MLSSWLNQGSLSSTALAFLQCRIEESGERTDDHIDYAAKILLTALVAPDFLSFQLRHLNDLGEMRQERVQSYLEEAILPGKDNQRKVANRVGMFGEALTAQIMVEINGFELPIYKLRYRETKDWAPRLTDVCLIKSGSDSESPLVCYIETKTKSAGFDKNIVKKGFGGLKKEDLLKDPEILHFISRRLYEQGEHDLLDLVNRICLGIQNYDIRHEVFVVHDAANWSDRAIGELDHSDISEGLIGLTVRTVLINELRSLIDECYRRTTRVAMQEVSYE